MNDPMMPPGMWATGVPEPNYAGGLMKFQQPSQQQQSPRAPAPGGQPLQLTPGAGQAKPVQPQPQGFGGGMNAMAGTMNAVPLAAALMRMFGGTSPMPAAPGQQVAVGQPGGLNPLGGSGIY